MVTALVAELPPQTPTPVSEAFVMVLVGFGVDWVTMWGGAAWLFSRWSRSAIIGCLACEATSVSRPRQTIIGVMVAETTCRYTSRDMWHLRHHQYFERNNKEAM
eukprot:scaffold159639_cov36-Cyclotella_meneghiniana.AAC.2